jgi:hypothetical protein
LKFGVSCDGYEIKKSKKEIPIIFPKRELAIKERPLPSVHLEPDLMFNLRGDAEDSQYFRFFRDETAFELCGGFFEEPLWTRMVLQSCHEAPCIHRIALSIAGLSRAMKTNHFKNPAVPKDSHEAYALQQYLKSLRHFRLFIKSNGTPDPRILLMAGLLIYCFECLQGNMDNAVQHIQSMMAVFKNARSLKEINYRHLPDSDCNGSFEDELLTQFARLDGQLIGRMYGQDPSRITVIGISHNLFDAFVIPDRFSDIRTARRYLEHMQHVSAPYVHHNENGQQVSTALIPEGPEISVAEGHTRMLRVKLAQWWLAFKPHFDLACTPDGDDNFVAAVILRVQALGSSLVLQTNRTLDFKQATESWADSELLTKREPNLLLSTSKELLHWCWKVASHRRFVKGFVFDTGIMTSLWCVLMMRFKRELIVEVIDLLREIAPRREGYWDALAVVHTAEALVAQQDASGW